MGRFFISYRRGDLPYAGWINEILTFELGEERVFLDVEKLRAGDDFARQLDQELEDCDAMVVVIGPAWSATGEGAGFRRLQEDYVQREIERTLPRGIPVIPVTVGGTPRPAVEELPDNVRDLLGRQAIELSDLSFRHDARRLLVARLKQVPQRKKAVQPDPPTVTLSPVSVNARPAPTLAGRFAFLWLTETFALRDSPGPRLAVCDRPRSWIGLYEVPIGRRFVLQDDKHQQLPIHVERPNVDPPRALRVFVSPTRLSLDLPKLTSNSFAITFLPTGVKNALCGSA